MDLRASERMIPPYKRVSLSGHGLTAIGALNSTYGLGMGTRIERVVGIVYLSVYRALKVERMPMRAMRCDTCSCTSYDAQ